MMRMRRSFTFIAVVQYLIYLRRLKPFAENTMPIEVVRGPDVPTSHLPFSPAIKAGGFVFVSGQASVDARTGQIISDTFENEFRRTMDNLTRILTAAGTGL